MVATASSCDMGVAAVVDELSQRQKDVCDHLDLSEQRKEVAQRILDHYKCTSARPNPAQVDQGVQDYLERRLSFVAPKPGIFQLLAARIYIGRSRWAGPLIKGVVAIVVTILLTYGVLFGIDLKKTSDVQAMADEMLQMERTIDSEVSRQTGKSEALQRSSDVAKSPAAQRVLEAITNDLIAIRAARPYTAPIRVSALTRDADRANLVPQIKSLEKIVDALRRSSARLVSVATVLDSEAEFNALVNHGMFATRSVRYPPLKRARAEAAQALENAHTRGELGAVEAVAKLRRTVSAADAAEVLREQQLTILAQFEAMALRATDKAQVSALSRTIASHLAGLDLKAAQITLEDFTNVLAIASTPLELNIVNRAGVKSGVERRHSSTGGKSWFLIVEATDPTGKVVAVPVKSVETGEIRNAQMFGVRVSHNEYERVKTDKMADGHVDERHMGRKPANSLTLKFNKRATSKPDLILEW